MSDDRIALLIRVSDVLALSVGVAILIVAVLMFIEGYRVGKRDGRRERDR